ncbi:MAG: hypothetical protein ACI9P8_000757 [Bacteroidia bacterium]
MVDLRPHPIRSVLRVGFLDSESSLIYLVSE